MKSTLFMGSLILLLLLLATSHKGLGQVPNATCAQEQPQAMRTINLNAISGNIIDQLNHKEVVITLDDGPHPWRTNKVLDTLDKHCLKATFFLMGQQAVLHPKTVKEIVSRGHTIGSHTYSHKNLTKLDLDQSLDELEKGYAPIQKIFADDPEPFETTLFRFPFIATTPELSAAVSEAGFRIIGVDADGADWTRNTPAESTDRIVQKLAKRGERGIILLHDPIPQSSKRLDHLIETLRENGYAFAHLVEGDKE